MNSRFTMSDAPSHDALRAGPSHARRQVRRRRRMRKSIVVLPTLFTLGNALCGFGSIFFASRDPDLDLPFHWTPLTFAAIFIFLGMILDALDGRIARLTRSMSDLGEQLDSMADMVTFGVAPAFMAVQLMGVQAPLFSVTAVHDRWFDRIGLVVGLIYVSCTALRLARFNVEADAGEGLNDKEHFKGLPSPGAAGTVASVVLLHQHAMIHMSDQVAWFAAMGMVVVTLLTACAMVSRLRYVHIVSRYIRGGASFTAIAYGMVVGLLALLVVPQMTLAVGFVGYALTAPVAAVWRAVHRPSKDPKGGG